MAEAVVLRGQLMPVYEPGRVRISTAGRSLLFVTVTGASGHEQAHLANRAAQAVCTIYRKRQDQNSLDVVILKEELRAFATLIREEDLRIGFLDAQIRLVTGNKTIDPGKMKAQVEEVRRMQRPYLDKVSSLREAKLHLEIKIDRRERSPPPDATILRRTDQK